jgi:hypothetical protein
VSSRRSGRTRLFRRSAGNRDANQRSRRTGIGFINTGAKDPKMWTLPDTWPLPFDVPQTELARPVDIVHTFPVELDSTAAGLLQIPHVFASSHCFQGPVMQFESHLGHDIFPRQRRFCFDVCTKLVVASLLRLIRGFWPGRRGGLSGVWGGGFKSPAGGPSACCGGVTCFLVSALSCWLGGGRHLFMVRGCAHNMTSSNWVRIFLEGSTKTSREPYARGLSCQKGCGHCPHLHLLCLIAGRKTDAGNLRVAGGA